MTDLTPLLYEADHLIAVVGATDSPYKYGSIIYRDLKSKGFNLVPVNPNRATVDGDVCYPNLASLPTRPTIIDFVVPPDQTLKVIQEAQRLGLDNFWLQPGSEDAKSVSALEASGNTFLAHACIMVRARTVN